MLRKIKSHRAEKTRSYQSSKTTKKSKRSSKKIARCDRQISDLKGTKKSKDNNVIASRLNNIEKDQLKTLNDQLNSDKQQSLVWNNQIDCKNSITKFNKIRQKTRDLVLRTRGISEEELQSEEKTRQQN